MNLEGVIVWLAVASIVLVVWQMTMWEFGAALIIVIALANYLRYTDRKRVEYEQRMAVREATWRAGDRRR